MKELLIPITHDDVFHALVELSVEHPNTYFPSNVVTCHILKSRQPGVKINQDDASAINSKVSTRLANLMSRDVAGLMRSEEKLTPTPVEEYSYLRFARSCWGYRYSKRVRDVLASSEIGPRSSKKNTGKKKASGEVLEVVDLIKDFSLEDLCHLNVAIASLVEERFGSLGSRLEAARLLALELGSEKL